MIAIFILNNDSTPALWRLLRTMASAVVSVRLFPAQRSEQQRDATTWHTETTTTECFSNQATDETWVDPTSVILELHADMSMAVESSITPSIKNGCRQQTPDSVSKYVCIHFSCTTRRRYDFLGKKDRCDKMIRRCGLLWKGQSTIPQRRSRRHRSAGK